MQNHRIAIVSGLLCACAARYARQSAATHRTPCIMASYVRSTVCEVGRFWSSISPLFRKRRPRRDASSEDMFLQNTSPINNNSNNHNSRWQRWRSRHHSIHHIRKSHAAHKLHCSIFYRPCQSKFCIVATGIFVFSFRWPSSYTNLTLIPSRGRLKLRDMNKWDNKKMQGWKLWDVKSEGKAEYGKMTGILHRLYDMHRIRQATLWRNHTAEAVIYGTRCRGISQFCLHPLAFI